MTEPEAIAIIKTLLLKMGGATRLTNAEAIRADQGYSLDVVEAPDPDGGVPSYDLKLIERTTHEPEV